MVLIQLLWCFCTGVLLDDLLVAEDLAAAETTSAALHQAALHSSAPSSQPNSISSAKAVGDGRQKTADGSVMMGSPVAAPAAGDATMDISTENALAHGHR